jgi:DNA-binding Lrp family transcriptional regulator
MAPEASVLIELYPGYDENELGEKIIEIKCVKRLTTYSSGPYYFIAEVKATTEQELFDIIKYKIRRMDGVRKTMTLPKEKEYQKGENGNFKILTKKEL